MAPVPHIIHYCWFGHNPLPKLALRCIASWRRYLPDYEIKEWNESNFDVNAVPYVAEAYRAGKYAFVSDYARFWVLYRYGGIYFDTDVEVIRPIDDLIAAGSFMGGEAPRDGSMITDYATTLEWGVAPGLGMAAVAGHPLLKELLDRYATMHFQMPDGTFNLAVVGTYTTDLLLQHGLQLAGGIQQVADFWIYPGEYFCPVHNGHRQLCTTINTRSIHHYAGSWKSPGNRFKHWVARHVAGPRITRWIIRCKRRLKGESRPIESNGVQVTKGVTDDRRDNAMPRLLIVTPELHRLGGVSNHHLGLSTHWTLPVSYLFYGKRTDRTPKVVSMALFGYDYLNYIVKLCRRRTVVMLNPSLRRTLVLRDGLLLLTARLLRRPVVVFFHGFNVDYADRLHRHGRLFSWCYNKAAFIYVLYSGFRTQLQDAGIKAPILLTTTKVADELVSGVDIPVREAVNTLLFVARVVPEKGIFITLEAFEILQRSHPELSLRICGDGTALAAARAHVERRGLKHVVFEGNVTGDRLRDNYLAADLYLLPTTHPEGMATTVLEAMSFGLPVVSRPVGGVQDFWSEEYMGVLLQSLAPADYAACIERLMNDPERVRRISAFNAQYAKSHFLASKVTKKIEKDILEIKR